MPLSTNLIHELKSRANIFKTIILENFDSLSDFPEATDAAVKNTGRQINKNLGGKQEVDKPPVNISDSSDSLNCYSNQATIVLIIFSLILQLRWCLSLSSILPIQKTNQH